MGDTWQYGFGLQAPRTPTEEEAFERYQVAWQDLQALRIVPDAEGDSGRVIRERKNAEMTVECERLWIEAGRRGPNAYGRHGGVWLYERLADK